MLIREAKRADLEAIGAIYDHEVRTSTSTFDTEPRDAAAQAAWFESHQCQAYPLLVAEEDGEVVGWASLTPWSDRGAYVRTVEGSLFITGGRRQSGVGLELGRALLERARLAGHHVVVGRIEASNEASRQLMLRMGFRSVGVMHEVGQKFGRVLNVEVFELLVEGAGADETGPSVQLAAGTADINLRSFRPTDADACFQIRADAYVREFFAELGPEAAAAAIKAFLPSDYVTMARDGAICVAESAPADSESSENVPSSGGSSENARGDSASTIVGFCVVRRLDGATGELLLVYVRREYHRRGIGGLLVRWAESWLQEAIPGLERIIVDTVIPGYNQRFYELMGYQVLTRKPHEFPGRTVEAVRLEKRVGL